MPVYEYSCSTCGKKFEKNLPLSADHYSVECPSGHKTVHRIYTPTAVMFKGSGFYVTDHPHSSSGPGKD